MLLDLQSLYNGTYIGTVGLAIGSIVPPPIYRPAEIDVYDLNSCIRLSGAFQDIDGHAIDPTEVTLYLKNPDASIITETTNIVRDGTGLYHYDVTLTQVGRYYFRYEGAGLITAAGEIEFRVRRSKIVTT